MRLRALVTLCLLASPGFLQQAGAQAVPITAQAFVGSSFDQTFGASPAPTPALCPCDFSTTSALPANLQQQNTPTGLRIFGTPTVPGTFPVEVFINGSDKVSKVRFNLVVGLNVVNTVDGAVPAPPPLSLAVTGIDQHSYNAHVAIHVGNIDCPIAAPTLALPGNLSVDAEGNLTSPSLQMLNGAITVSLQCAAPVVGAADFTIVPAATTLAIAAQDEPNKQVIAALNNPPAFGKYKGRGIYDGVCDYPMNDCDWHFNLMGGVEQADLSSQSSQTEPFIELFLRDPMNMRWGSVWLRARFLGTPGPTGTQNVVAAATNPTTTVTSNNLATVGAAVDYVIGVEHDFFQPRELNVRGLEGIGNPKSGAFTLGLIGGFGATSPLDSTAATIAFVVPDYGTNECTQLQARFGAGNTYGYRQTIPGPGTVPATTGTNPTPAMNYCVLQTSQPPAGGSGAATNQPITNIAFSPQDRSSLLLKYGVGLRLINRWHSGSSNFCAPDTKTQGIFTHGPCWRSVVDFTFGQDQAITRGQLRSFVFKSDITVPILETGISFFGNASIRTEKNVDLPPLVLTSAPIAASAGAAGIQIPSKTVFVLPLKESNRDFYRFGIALDLRKVLPKLFGLGS